MGNLVLDQNNTGTGTTRLQSPATPTLDVDSVINAAIGYRVGNAAAAGSILRGNGINFVPTTYPLVTVLTTGFGPLGTTSLTGVMMGLGANGYIYTPTLSGNIKIWISGGANNNITGDGINGSGHYGSGPAPANGVAATGTTFAINAQQGISWSVNPVTSLVGYQFLMVDKITGLIVRTPYWFDIAIKAVTGGTAGIQGIRMMIEEY